LPFRRKKQLPTVLAQQLAGMLKCILHVTTTTSEVIARSEKNWSFMVYTITKKTDRTISILVGQKAKANTIFIIYYGLSSSKMPARRWHE